MTRPAPTLSAPVAALFTVLGLAACATDLPFPPVPPLQADIRPIPPIATRPLIWRPGDWLWTGSGYAWQPGAYEPAGAHSANWLAGHWEGTRGQYVWVPGHWL